MNVVLTIKHCDCVLPQQIHIFHWPIEERMGTLETESKREKKNAHLLTYSYFMMTAFLTAVEKRFHYA